MAYTTGHMIMLRIPILKLFDKICSDAADSEHKLFAPKFNISKDDMKFVPDINGIELFDNKNSEIKEQSEWSNTLNELICEYSRLPCAWPLKRQKNVANERAVSGSCRAVKCDAAITIFTENNKSKMIMIIKNCSLNARHIEIHCKEFEECLM